MRNLTLRVQAFASGDVGIYAEKSGPEIVRIHRLTVHHATGSVNYNKIYTLYPENASTLLEIFSPHSATTEIKAVATYEEIDHFTETTESYAAPTFADGAAIPQTLDELSG